MTVRSFYLSCWIVFLVGPLTWPGAKAKSESLEACATSLFRPMVARKYSTVGAVQAALTHCIRVVDDRRDALGPAGANVYRAEYCVSRPSVFAWFSFEESGLCTLISGDLNDLLGVQLSPSERAAFALVGFNQVAAVHPPHFESEEAILNYLLAAINLIEPSGSVVMISNADDVWSASSEQERPKERRMSGKIARQIKAPTIVRDDVGLTTVTFFTWADVGGLVLKNEFLIWPDGQIARSEDLIESRVGPYVSEFRSQY